MTDATLFMTASERALGTVEILENILSHFDFIELLTFQKVHPDWRSVQLQSPLLRRALFLKASRRKDLIFWRLEDGKRVPIFWPLIRDAFNAFPQIHYNIGHYDLESEKLRSAHWPAMIVRPHPMVDCTTLPQKHLQPIRDAVKRQFRRYGAITTHLILDTRKLKSTAYGPWCNAFLCQPPCLMSEVQVVVPIKEASERGGRLLGYYYLDDSCDEHATLGMVKVALANIERKIANKIWRPHVVSGRIKQEDAHYTTIPSHGCRRLFIEYALDERSPWVRTAREGHPLAVEGPPDSTLTGL